MSSSTFHEAEVSAVEIILIAHVVNLFEFLYSVEIEMIDRLTVPGCILIHDGECR